MLLLRARPIERSQGSLTAIEAAVIDALSYADAFDWPLTPAEVHCFLPVAANLADVLPIVGSLHRQGVIGLRDGLAHLAPRADLFDRRRALEASSRRLWPRARRAAAVLARLPFVRLVGVTGSLAVNAAAADADIDLFIVTADDRLWLTRAAAIGVVRTGALAGTRLCPNYLLAELALELPATERDRFTAHELAQLVPLAGAATYARLLEANAWYRELLPNHRPGDVPPAAAAAGSGLLERPLRARPFDRLERWEMRRKIRRLSAGDADPEARFGPDRLQGPFRRPSGARARGLRSPPGRSAGRSERGGGMTRVLLGQSYYLRFDPKLHAAMQPYPPLGTLYAASWLRERGYEVGLFDAMLEPDESGWERSLDAGAGPPEFAILYEDNFNYLSKMCLLRMREAAFTMLAAARARGATTIVCGSDATDNAGRYLERGADWVIVGEGEVTLADLLDRLSGRRGRGPARPGGAGLPRCRRRAHLARAGATTSRTSTRCRSRPGTSSMWTATAPPGRATAGSR